MIRINELAGLCQTIARDTGLEVTVGGEESFITPDGRRLNIAAMPMTPEGRLVAVGLAWHEVGHKLYTDMEGGPGHGLLGDLVNVIEDVREERDFILDRPGAAYDLDAVATYYVSRGYMDLKDSTSAVIALTMGYGRLHILDQKALEPILATAQEILEAEFGGAFLALAEGILKGFHSMPTGKEGTEASKEMARQLVQLLEHQAEDPPDPPPPQPDSASDQDIEDGGNDGGNEDDDTSGNRENGSGDSQDDTSAGSDKDGKNGAGNSENQENQQDAGKGSGQPQQKNGGEDSRNGRSTGSNSDTEGVPCKDNSPGNSSNSPSPGTEGLEGQDQDEASCDSSPVSSGPRAAGSRMKTDPAMIRKMIEEGAGDFGNLRQMAINELNELSAQVSPEERNAIPQLPRVDRIKPNELGLVDEPRCITTTSRMRAKLMGLLQAVKRLPERYGISGRKLAVNRLARMATGDPRFFRKRVESVAVNTAVVVLLDRSGSMNSQSRISVARNAAFSLHHALSGIAGVAAHSVAFEMDDEEQNTPPIKVLCNWGEKPRSEHFGADTGCCTPTPWALWYARAELLARLEPRKIVLLVTDGMPEGWDGIGADTRAATARLNRDGIEIAAIGIETDSVKDYWKNSRVINDLDELPVAMFGVMTDLLTSKAA